MKNGETNNELVIPRGWFTTLKNHTAIFVLADILSAYRACPKGQLVRSDLDELVLRYGDIAKRLEISEKSVQRALNLLAAMKVLRRRMADRRVQGTHTRQVVSVTPDYEVLAKLSAQPVSAVTALWPMLKTIVNQGRGTDRSRKLTDAQRSLLNAYKSEFRELVGWRYRTTKGQRRADIEAARTIQGSGVRGSTRKYFVWARQYLEALVLEAGEDVHSIACGPEGNARWEFTFEAWAEWVNSDNKLPNRKPRRQIS